MHTERAEFASSIVEQLHGLVGNVDAYIDQVVLSRWGHAMCVPLPGFFGKVSNMMHSVSGNYAIAHCSSQGLACAESAVKAAKLATKQAMDARTTKTWAPVFNNPLAAPHSISRS